MLSNNYSLLWTMCCMSKTLLTSMYTKSFSLSLNLLEFYHKPWINMMKRSVSVFITLTCIFLKLFQIPWRRAHHSERLFPAEYEYLNNFFPARPNLKKFHVEGLKITLNACLYLVLMLKITNNFNVMHAYSDSKWIYL